jgi:SAM-dependent methyltransferase
LEAHEYQTLFEMESSYWWFKGLHSILLDTFRALPIAADARILDAGCGTGQNLSNINREISPNTFGFDISSEAAKFWKNRNLERTCIASINQIPFADESFDAVVSVDVLECCEVDDNKAYAELWRVTKPQGHIILVAPAYEWLMSPEHHKAVGANRRYSRPRLRELLSQKPAEILRITHLFASLFPAIASYRLTKKLSKPRLNGPPRSELKPMPPMLNSLLFNIIDQERRVLRRTDLPFGSSILAVCRKV